MITLDRKALHEALDERRQAEGMRWADVAGQSGVVASTLSRLAGGYGSPSADGLLRLMSWLGVTDIRSFIRAGRSPAPKHARSPRR